MGLFKRMGARVENREWDRLAARIGMNVPEDQRVGYLYCSRVSDPFSPVVDGVAYATRHGLLVVPERGEPRFFDHLDLDKVELAGPRFINFDVREHDTKKEWAFALRSNQPDQLTANFYGQLVTARRAWMENAMKQVRERS